MANIIEAFVAFDTSKLRNAVAIAEAGRAGEVRFLGEIENTEAAIAKLVRKLAAKYGRLTFCYEAGPTGYGLYRQIKSLGHECMVVAPSRQGLHYPGERAWTKAHRDWLVSQKLEYAEHRIAFEEMLLAMRQAQERIERLEQAIRMAIPDWSLAEVVTALMARRGIDFISATAFLAEVGDLSRFRTPRELMAYLGLVPSEASTGDTVKRGPITKAGNRRARRILVECSWSYQHP